MAPTFLLLVAAVTSVGAFVAGTTQLRLSARTLGQAVGKTLEGIGLTLVFLALNLSLGGSAILAARVITGRFVSLYLLADESVLWVSLLQGVTFLWWRDRGGLPSD